MSKKAKYGMLGAVILAMVVAAAVCFFSFRGGRYVSSLPADMQAVARVDARTLQKKIALPIAKQQQSELEHSGIDFTHPLYAFVDGHDSPGVLLPLRSAGDFKAYLQGMGIEVQKQRGYSWAQSGQWLMAFSDDRCLVRGPLSEQEMGPMRGQMVSLMKQSGKPDNPLLQHIDDSKAPVCASFSVGLVQHLLVRFVPDASAVFHGEQTGTVGMDVDFKDKRIAADVTLHGTGVGEGKSFLVPLDEPATLPESADGACVLTMGVNGEALLTLLRSYPVVRTALLALNFTFDLDQMIRAIQGDVNLSVVNDGSENPQIAMAARFKDTHFRQSLGDLTQYFYPISDGGVEVLDDSTFCVGLSGDYLYAGLRGNRLAACTDQTFGKSVVRDMEEGHFVSKKDAVGSLVYMQLDLAAVLRHPRAHTFLARYGVDSDSVVGRYDKLVLRVKADEKAATTE